MSCTDTHKLIIKRLGSQVIERTWIKLADASVETDPTVLASLEAGINDATCQVDVNCDLTKIWSIVGDNGVRLQQWTDNAIDTGAELPTISIFTEEDDEGYPAHQNAADVDTTRGTFLQPNIVGVDQHQLDAWVYVPETARLQDSAGLVETGEIYLGTCGGPMSLAESWQATPPYSAREFATLNAGFHRIRVYINDYSPDSSSFNLQWDVGGAWTNVPAEYLFLEKPDIVCRNVRICGDTYFELDDTEITLEDFDYTCEPALCGDAGSTTAMSETCWKVREDLLAIDNAGTGFGGEVQSVVYMKGESNGEAFEITAPVGTYTFSGTNGSSQTASMSQAFNDFLDDNEIFHSAFTNEVATVSGRYLAWTPLAKACPDFNVTEAIITRSNGVERALPIYREEGDLAYYTRRACDGCTGGYEWVDAVGQKVPQPEAGCLRPCGEPYPEVDPPSDPTCVPLEPTVVCYDTDGDGEADLSIYNIATACNGIIDSVESYDLESVSANPSDPDLWVSVTVPANAEPITCAGATLLSSSTLCDSEGTLHDVRIYEFGGVEYQETYVPGTNTQSTVVGALGSCGVLSPINVKKCVLDNTATLQVWNPNFIDINAGESFTAAFSDTDAYGLPAHPNDPDTVSTTTVARIYNGNTGPAANTVTENAQLDFYVLPPLNQSAIVRVGGGAVETGAVYVGDSPANAELAASWIDAGGPTPTTVATISNNCCAGKFFRVYLVDPSADNAEARMQWSLDGGTTWADIPADNLSSDAPYCETEVRWVSEGGVVSLTDTESIGTCDCVPEEEPDEPTCGFEKLYSFGEGVENGINAAYWGANAAPHADIEAIFTDWQTHINGAADTVGVMAPNTFTVNDVTVASAIGATNTSLDQALIYTWVHLEEGMYLREVNGNTGERLALYESQCVLAPELKAIENDATVGGRTGLGDLGYYEAGLYFMAFQWTDVSASGGIQVQQSTDGSTWVNMPLSQLYAEKPTWSCRTIKVCDNDTRFELDGTPLTIADNESLCPDNTCAGSVGAASGGTHVIEGCVVVDGQTVNGYTVINDSGNAMFAPRPLTDLGFVDCCAVSYGTPADGVLVSDNFQDGNGNAPFNLQVRNTTNTATDWTAVVRDVDYATIPSLNAGTYTLSTSGTGPYTHVFTGTGQLGAFANITITGGTPSPAGVGTADGNPELYI